MGVKVRDLQAHGQQVPEELRGRFEEADEKVFAHVRALFGGNSAPGGHRRGADRPRDPRVLLRAAASRCSRATG